MNNHFFSAMRAVGKRIIAAPRLLLGLDFDGTLAPIEEDPTSVFLPTGTKQILETLAGHNGVTLAFVSGRSLADLQERVSITGAIYAGNHGLEISGPGFRFVEPGAVAASKNVKDLGLRLTDALQHIGGVVVEDKELTLSIHYRRAAAVDGEEVWRKVQAAVAGATEFFHLTKGNKVYEIRPHLRWHKGSALQWIQQRLGQPHTLVIYLGDDVTDEDAFSVLADSVMIKIGDSAATKAQYVLHDPSEVSRFLEWIDGLVRTKGTRG